MGYEDTEMQLANFVQQTTWLL